MKSKRVVSFCLHPVPEVGMSITSPSVNSTSHSSKLFLDSASGGSYFTIVLNSIQNATMKSHRTRQNMKVFDPLNTWLIVRVRPDICWLYLGNTVGTFLIQTKANLLVFLKLQMKILLFLCTKYPVVYFEIRIGHLVKVEIDFTSSGLVSHQTNGRCRHQLNHNTDNR